MRSMVIDLVKKAGEKIMEEYGNDEAFLKEDKSPLTAADLKSNAVLMNLPGNIISEEKLVDYEERRDWDEFWLVDPLDGTKEFLKKNGEFTVNVALIRKGKPVLGVVYAPAMDLMYSTDGISVWKNGEILEKKTPPHMAAVSRSHLSEATKNYLDEKKFTVMSVGSSLKFCYVAEGKVEEYPRFEPCHEWDTAAAHAICLAMGVHVKDFSGEELRYNKESTLQPQFICR